MITSPRLSGLLVQQVADLLSQVGPADLGGGCQGVAEHLASLIGLARGHQQLAQVPAHDGEPVGSLQAAEDLERLGQPGEGCLVVLSREVDLSQVPAGGGDPVEVAELLAHFQPFVLQLAASS